MATASGRRWAAVIAPAALRKQLEAELEAAPLEPLWLTASSLAPFRARYRRTVLGIIGDPAAMPAAVVVQRWSKVPWLAVLDADGLRALRARPRALRSRAVRQAGAVVVEPPLAEEAETLAPGRRITHLGDGRQLARIAADTALGDGARGPAYGVGSVVADAWTFINDRAARLTIRSIPLTRKAPHPIHPRHLIGGSWHLWYLPELRSGDRVLDVGCSNGAHTLVVATRVQSVVGVDVDGVELERARERATAERVSNVDFRLLDLADPDALDRLGRHEFDVALVLDVLEHLVGRVDVLRGIRALLRPGGRLVLSVPNRETPYRRLLRRLGGFAFSDPDHKVEYTDASLAAELRAAGFRILKSERGGYDTPFAGVSTLLALLSLRAYRALAERRSRLSQRHPERATALRVVAVPIET